MTMSYGALVKLMSSVGFFVKARDMLLSEDERSQLSESAATPKMSCNRKLTFYDSDVDTDTETPSPMVIPPSQYPIHMGYYEDTQVIDISSESEEEELVL